MDPGAPLKKRCTASGTRDWRSIVIFHCKNEEIANALGWCAIALQPAVPARQIAQDNPEPDRLPRLSDHSSG
jgi:hypothetical protein